MDTVEIYLSKRLLDRTAQWRWRYIAEGNNARLANGGESYIDYHDCLRSVGRVVGFDFFDNNDRDLIWARGSQKETVDTYQVHRFNGDLLKVKVTY